MASGVLYVYVDQVRGGSIAGARKIYARVSTPSGRAPAATTATAKPAPGALECDLRTPAVAVRTTEDDEEAVVSIYNAPRIGPDVLLGVARVPLWGAITERAASAVVPLTAPGKGGVAVGDVAVRLTFEPAFVQRQQQQPQQQPQFEAPQQQPQYQQYSQQEYWQLQQQQQVWGMPASSAGTAPLQQQQQQHAPPQPAGYPTSGGQLPMMPVMYGNPNVNNQDGQPSAVAARPGGGSGGGSSGLAMGLVAGLGAGLLLDALF